MADASRDLAGFLDGAGPSGAHAHAQASAGSDGGEGPSSSTNPAHRAFAGPSVAVAAEAGPPPWRHARNPFPLPFLSAKPTASAAAASRRRLLQFAGQRASRLVHLPDHVLYGVFKNLQDRDLCTAAMVCQQWREQSEHEDFWKHLSFEQRNVTQAQVLTLCRKYPKVQHLNVRGVRGMDEAALGAMLRDLPSLVGLVLGQQALSDALLHRLCTNAPHLTSLELTEPVISPGPPVDLNFVHPTLQTLVIVNARAARVVVHGEVLRKLVMRRTYAAPLLLTCPQLTHLDLSASKLTDVMIRTSATSVPLLTHLLLPGCTPLCDETLREVVDLSCCPNVALDGVRFPALESFTLGSCDALAAASFEAINASASLEELALDDCALLPTATVTLPLLRTISCSGCRSLRTLRLTAPALTALNLAGCHLLAHVEITSSALRSLTLRHLLELRTVRLQCPGLVEVELSDCDKLTDDAFASLSDANGCPVLERLALDQCESLVHGDLASGSLQELSMVGCKGLETLTLACPSLRRVALNECDRLVVARLAPVGLPGQLDLGICPRLEKLTLKAPQLEALKLCGCGYLRDVHLDCPALLTLNTAFCTRIKAACLAEVPATCAALSCVSLAYCSSAVAPMLPQLPHLQALTRLDLSYTEVEDLACVLQGCMALSSLKLQACKRLRDDALEPLLSGGRLPALRELDLSFCDLSEAALRNVLCRGATLTSLNLSACTNATHLPSPGADHLPAPTSAAGGAAPGNGGPLAQTIEHAAAGTVSGERTPPALRTLLCVGCPALRSLVLRPSQGLPFLHLQHVNLRLSVVTEVVLELASLQTLDLRECSALTHLRLECPSLNALHLQGCLALPATSIKSGVEHAPLLATLDIRDLRQLSPAAIERIQLACPKLRRMFTSSRFEH